MEERIAHPIPAASPFLKVCTALDLQAMPMIDLAGFAAPQQVVLINSVLVKFSEPVTTFQKMKAEFLKFHEERKKNTKLRQTLKEVGQKLGQIRFALAQIVTILNATVSKCKKTPRGEFLMELRLAPSLTQLTLKLVDLSKTMQALLNNHLCKPEKGIIVSLRRRINQRRKNKGVGLEVQVEEDESAGEDLEFFSPVEDLTWGMSSTLLACAAEDKHDKLQLCSIPQFHEYFDLISSYGYLDISGFTSGLPTVRAVRKAMREISQYLPVLSFRTGKKVVLVDSFRSDAVQHVVWETLFLPLVEHDETENKSSAGACGEDQNMEVIKDVLERITATIEKDEDVNAVMEKLLMQVELSCEELPLEDSDAEEPGQVHEASPSLNKNPKGAGRKPLFELHPQLVPTALAYLELQGQLKAHDRRRSEVLERSNGTTLADLKEHLESKIEGLKISRSAVRYLFVAPKHNTREATRYHEVLSVKSGTKNNDITPDHVDDHHCKATVRFIKTMCQQWQNETQLFSVDSKAKANCNNKPVVSRYHNQRKYFVTSQMPRFGDHDYPLRRYLIVPDGILRIDFEDCIDRKTGAQCTQKKGVSFSIFLAKNFYTFTFF